MGALTGLSGLSGLSGLVGSGIVPFTPAQLTGLWAWFDPSFGTYSDAGITPANVGDPVYRHVSRNDPLIYVEQATIGNRPVLRQGANGKYFLEHTSDFWGDFVTVPSSNGIWTFHSLAFTLVGYHNVYDRGGLPPQKWIDPSGQFEFNGGGGVVSGPQNTGNWLVTQDHTNPSTSAARSRLWIGTTSIGDTAAGAITAPATNIRFFNRGGAGDAYKGKCGHWGMYNADLSSVDRLKISTFCTAEFPT